MFNIMYTMSNVMFTMNQFKKNSNEKGNTIYIEGGPGKGLSNNMWAIATAIYYRENYGMNIMLRETDSILFGTSNKFQDIIKSCTYSSFRIDWNIFKDMKKDFWKDFI